MKRKPTPTQREELFSALRARFDKHMSRHPGLEWANVQARLESSPDKLAALQAMEDTGGEPDVVVWGEETSGYLFVDCSEQTPKGRVSACYDLEGLKSRKEHLPEITAVEMAAEMGIELLTEERYQDLQKLGEFDTKTSSWVKTPASVRSLGGALYGERRYGRIFIGHNGAQSYYAARGFRGSLRI